LYDAEKVFFINNTNVLGGLKISYSMKLN